MTKTLRHALLMVGIVLVANGLALAIVARNASGMADAVVTLTEREARLVATDAENTAMLLAWQWDGRVSQARPAGFTAAQLTSLGFACSVAPGSPAARQHYQAPTTLPRPAFVAVAILPDAPPDAPLRPDQVPPERARAAAGGALSRSEEERQRASRLSILDVGLDAAALRRAYPDRHAVFITRGLVRLEFVPANADGAAHLEGRVVSVEPATCWVPRQWQPRLAALAGSSREASSLPLDHEPRYQVVVRYGRDLLPTLVDVRPLR
jgi:hypothetical protein